MWHHNVVFEPVCSSRPFVTNELKRTTVSKPSMTQPKPRSRIDGPLPTRRTRPRAERSAAAAALADAVGASASTTHRGEEGGGEAETTLLLLLLLTAEAVALLTVAVVALLTAEVALQDWGHRN